jgi:hypothetical protein
VRVAVCEAWNDRPAVEIDHHRLRACQGADRGRGADRQKAIALHRKCFVNAVSGIDRDDLAVIEDLVRLKGGVLLSEQTDGRDDTSQHGRDADTGHTDPPFEPASM